MDVCSSLGLKRSHLCLNLGYIIIAIIQDWQLRAIFRLRGSKGPSADAERNKQFVVAQRFEQLLTCLWRTEGKEKQEQMAVSKEYLTIFVPLH